VPRADQPLALGPCPGRALGVLAAGLLPLSLELGAPLARERALALGRRSPLAFAPGAQETLALGVALALDPSESLALLALPPVALAPLAFLMLALDARSLLQGAALAGALGRPLTQLLLLEPLALSLLGAASGAAGAAAVVVVRARVEGRGAELGVEVVVAFAATQITRLEPRVERVGVL
jgi:hypothetical protein